MKDKKEEIQQKVLEFQILESSLRILEQREALIIEKLEELKRTKAALEELKNVKLRDAMIPLGSSNFISGKITDTENVVIGVGAGVAIKKKREDALKFVEDKIKELESSSVSISSQAEEILQRLRNLQNEIEKLQE